MQDILATVAAVYSDAGYTITVITDEEPVALAGAIPGKVASTPLFTGTVVAMVLVLAIVAATFYFIQCRQLQLRINALMEGTKVRRGHYNSWNIKSLKEEQSRLECIISDKLLEETVHI